ncbi:putative HTH-type transcriptional regulator YdeC [Bienertia sinuspersici]
MVKKICRGKTEISTLENTLKMTLCWNTLITPPYSPEFGNSSMIKSRRHGFKSHNHPIINIFSCHSNSNTNTSTSLKRCLRCNTLYDPLHNSPTACSFHAHITGEKGLLALAPPHQGIDGEWTDCSGVIVYKWNDKNNRPNTGSANWKKRWSCCSEYGENAPPCRKGWHVCYDDGFTMY